MPFEAKSRTRSIPTPKFKPADPLLDEHQVCDYLGKSLSWARNSRWLGTGPKFIKIGRSVRYRLSDVEAYIAENTRAA
jgi:predicted DNA-binding transcriptional regulator AlpA